MDQIKDSFFDTNIQAQVFSMALLVLILSVLSIIIYLKVKQTKPTEAPKGIALVAEVYVLGIDQIFTDATEEKISKPAPYIFTLITFLIFGNLMGLIGLEPPVTSYSVPLTLAIVSWAGIYVVGITYQKWTFFKRFLNPVTLVVGQFTPIISLSFRIFGNIIGGSTIMYLVYYVTGWIWSYIPVIGDLNVLGALFAPLLHAYFDIVGALIQAYVFTLLTLSYWAGEAEVPVSIKKKNKEIKATVTL